MNSLALLLKESLKRHASSTQYVSQNPSQKSCAQTMG